MPCCSMEGVGLSRLPLRPGGGRGRGKLGRPPGDVPPAVVREASSPVARLADAAWVSICRTRRESQTVAV